MSRSKSVFTALVIAAIGLATFIAYRYDPMSGTFPFPRCTFKLLTGWDCPGCGSTRALHALLHGHVADAWNANPASFVAVILVALYLVAETPRFSLLRALLFSRATVWMLILSALLWTILRNLLGI